MPNPQDDAPQPTPEPQDLSRLLMAQIEQRLKDSLGTAQGPSLYYVIRSQKTGVMSVLSASTLGQDHDVVYGPQPFAGCIAYVNGAVVGRRAPDPEENP